MPVDTVWSNPATALTRAAGLTLPYAYWEDLISNVNRLGGADGDTKTGTLKFASADPNILAQAANSNLYIKSIGTGVLFLNNDAGARVEIGNTTSGVVLKGPIGFFAASGSAKLAVTGAKSGNAALGSLLTHLATYGLITDSSSA